MGILLTSPIIGLKRPKLRNHKVIHSALAIFAGLVSLLYMSLCSTTLAQISIAPLGGVLDSVTDEVTFRVTNPSDRELDLKVNWTDLQALPSGLYRPSSIEERRFSSAARYLEVSPASLKLVPGEGAIIRVKRRGDDPQYKGEFRSHLTLTGTYSKALMRKAAASLPLDLGVTVTVPVSLRHLTKGASANFNTINLSRDAEGMLSLNVELGRQGDETWTGMVLAELPNGAHWQRPVRLFPETSLSQRVLPLGVSALPEGELLLSLTSSNAGKPHDIKTISIGPPVAEFSQSRR